MRRCLLVLSLVLITGACSSTIATKGETTGILGAFDAEVELLKAEMEDKKETVIMGIPFTEGVLKGRSVVLAETGVGKVNAAVTTTLLIEHYDPEEVVFTGIAGGVNPGLNPGDIIIGLKTAHHDYVQIRPDGVDTMPTRKHGGERNPLFIPSDERLCRLAKEAGIGIVLDKIFSGQGRRSPAIRSGVIVTGDSFISDDSKKEELRFRLNADAVEMEGAAVAQVCFQNMTPFVIIRCLSDRADRNAPEEIQRFYKAAARNSAFLVLGIIELLARDSSLE